MASLVLYPLFYGVEVFLASAFVTQVAVSVAAIVVSTVTFYICKAQVNQWRETHEDTILTWALFNFSNQGDTNASARIKISRPFDEYASGDTDRSSSENEVFGDTPSLLLTSTRLDEEYGGSQRKPRGYLRSEPTPDRTGVRERRGQGDTPAGLGARSYSLPATAGGHSERQRSTRRPKQEAMHRSHWVAKPQQNVSVVRKGILIPVSEGEIQAFPVPPSFRKRRERSKESQRRTPLGSSSSSLSSSSAESDDVHLILPSTSSECTELPSASSPSVQEIKKPNEEEEEIIINVCLPSVPSICVDDISEKGTIQPQIVEVQEEIPKERDNIEVPIIVPPNDKPENDALSSELVSFEPTETHLAILPTPIKDTDKDVKKTLHKTNAPRLTAICTSTVTIRVTPSEDPKTEKPKRRSSPPVILAEIAYPGEDDDNHVDEIVLPYNRPVPDIVPKEETHEELPPQQTTDKSPVVSSEEIHLARHDSLGVPPVYVGEVSFPGPIDTRPPPPPYCVAIKDVTPRHSLPEVTPFISSLDVPQIAIGEISFPPLPEPAAELVRKKEITRRRDTILDRRLGSQKVRPRSLDIPIIITTPDDDEEDTDFDKSHGVKRKHGSILKRSASTDRPGQKKSVTFSPDVPPYDETKRGTSRRGRRVCKRQKAIRHHSVDSPDPTIPHVEFDFGSFLTIRHDDKPPPTYEEFLSMSPPPKASTADRSNERDTFTRASGNKEEVNKANIVFDRRWPHPFAQSALKKVDVSTADDETLKKVDVSTDDDDATKKSAKDRFFEACGAKAVISVLCTQESISEPSGIRMPDNIKMSDQDNGSSFTGSSATVSNVNDDDQPPDVTYTATRPLSDHGAAKTRFFGVKEDELLTSQLFSQAVRFSVDSDTAEPEKLSAPNSPTLVEEEEPGEDDEDTSAKSRFLMSCEDEGSEEDEADDEASMAIEEDKTNRQRRQPKLQATAHIEVTESSQETGSEETTSSSDDEELLHSINRRGSSERYRGFLEASTEDMGYIDSDEDVGDLETVSVHSMGTDTLSKSPSTVETLAEIEDRTSSMTRPGIKTHAWEASAYSHRYLNETAIVLDNGSEVLKAGMAGSYLPEIVIPTVIGRRKSETTGDHIRARTKKAVIGHDVMGNKQGVMSFDYPIEDGIIDNWNDLEAIWEHVMHQELALTPGEHPILLSEIATAPREQREKCLEVMFEKLNVPALYVANQAALALYANADTSGLVLSSGSGITEVIPVLDGNTLKHAVVTLDIAGKEVTRQLGRLLQMEKGYSFSSSSERETLRNMKESLAYVCPDYEAEMLRVKHATPSEFRLPDGSPLSLDQSDLFRCTETLFQPEIAGILNQSGVADLIMESLQRCDSEFLCTGEPSILLTGGNTKLMGFVDRIKSELTRAKIDRAITAPEERIFSTWVGGSILASHSSFSERWISMEDYAEHGANIVNRRSSLF